MDAVKLFGPRQQPKKAIFTFTLSLSLPLFALLKIGAYLARHPPSKAHCAKHSLLWTYTLTRRFSSTCLLYHIHATCSVLVLNEARPSCRLTSPSLLSVYELPTPPNSPLVEPRCHHLFLYPSSSASFHLTTSSYSVCLILIIILLQLRRGLFQLFHSLHQAARREMHTVLLATKHPLSYHHDLSQCFYSWDGRDNHSLHPHST